MMADTRPTPRTISKLLLFRIKNNIALITTPQLHPIIGQHQIGN